VTRNSEGALLLYGKDHGNDGGVGRLRTLVAARLEALSGTMESKRNGIAKYRYGALTGSISTSIRDTSSEYSDDSTLEFCSSSHSFDEQFQFNILWQPVNFDFMSLMHGFGGKFWTQLDESVETPILRNQDFLIISKIYCVGLWGCSGKPGSLIGV
jgi:hypothetical protein